MSNRCIVDANKWSMISRKILDQMCRLHGKDIAEDTIDNCSTRHDFAGCSVELPLRVQQSAPPDYRQLAADSISASFPITGAFFSDIKAAIAPQPADWFACVKLSDGKYFSVFYADGKVSEFRRAVGVDRCEEAQGYAPMPAPKPPNTKKGSKT